MTTKNPFRLEKSGGGEAPKNYMVKIPRNKWNLLKTDTLVFYTTTEGKTVRGLVSRNLVGTDGIRFRGIGSDGAKIVWIVKYSKIDSLSVQLDAISAMIFEQLGLI